MKYVILIGDGMGDYPLPELDGQTPLEAARTPNMDGLARRGELGLARTIPPGMEPGSDIANLAIMGYDPARYHTGRAPLEAAALGVELAPDEVAFRCNLVTLRGEPGGIFMEDYAAGHITSDEAKVLIEDLEGALGQNGRHFYPGVSYRHLLTAICWSGIRGTRAGRPTRPTTSPARKWAASFSGRDRPRRCGT
jgi:2,3-bisphosphoglycerate-independent phosphoglycerate mutase